MVVQDVLALLGQRAGILITPDELALGVGDIGEAAFIVPVMSVSFRQTARTTILAQALIITFSLTIERHSHHQFLARHAGLQMSLDRLR